MEAAEEAALDSFAVETTFAPAADTPAPAVLGVSTSENPASPGTSSTSTTSAPSPSADTVRRGFCHGRAARASSTTRSPKHCGLDLILVFLLSRPHSHAHNPPRAAQGDTLSFRRRAASSPQSARSFDSFQTRRLLHQPSLSPGTNRRQQKNA